VNPFFLKSIVHVETVGAYKPEELVTEAIGKLKEKVHQWIEVLEEQQDE